MTTLDEPYIAVLRGRENSESVEYGDPKVLPASTSVDDAKSEALHWATDLQRQIGKKAVVILKKGDKGIFSREFDEPTRP